MHDKIGQMVRYHRKKEQLSLHALAEKAGVGKTVVFDVEHGKRSVQVDILFKILKALDIQLLFRTPVADVSFKD